MAPEHYSRYRQHLRAARYASWYGSYLKEAERAPDAGEKCYWLDAAQRLVRESVHGA